MWRLQRKKDKQDSAGEFPEHAEGSSARALRGKCQCQGEVARARVRLRGTQGRADVPLQFGVDHC